MKKKVKFLFKAQTKVEVRSIYLSITLPLCENGVGLVSSDSMRKNANMRNHFFCMYVCALGPSLKTEKAAFARVVVASNHLVGAAPATVPAI